MNKTVDQQIALFGQSGSGKTALLCSFYGTARESSQDDVKLFEISADDDRHTELMKLYLGMKDDSLFPPTNRFKSKNTVFSLKQKGVPIKEAGKADQVRVTWNDYPGEWFEGGTTTESEKQDKINTFRNLLGSDVALFLVDGQKLHDYADEEERYLRYLFDSFTESLNQIKEAILEDGTPLQQFPRIWVIALSKADLWPDLTVTEFENLLIKKAGNEINELRSKLLEFIDNDDAFSFGKDFLLLSSAKFTPGHIDLSQRKGVDVLLPLACVLPIQHQLWWQELRVLPINLANRLVGNEFVKNGMKIIFKMASNKFIDNKKGLAMLVFAELVMEMLDQPEEQLHNVRGVAIEKREFLKALTADFTSRLKQAQTDKILVWDFA
ncbi:TRAFAC clade GTPase domain-containing protein [Corynebacterium glutamicum]|uniref:TRAFAC clade GTPase domain-containing protein n=1 Tax=Corynebacterium glutamicum TaxID=1718 RepID=UPI000AC762E3|nr:ATP-binding protein [Corynebacterium glutamicum]